MSRCLYAFVDESNHPSNDDWFAVAACWCVSAVPVRATLNETRVSALDFLQDLDVSVDTELKSTHISDPSHMDALLSTLDHTLFYNAPTLSESPYPWAPDPRPVRFTTQTVDSTARQELFRLAGQNKPDAPEAMRTSLLLSILHPLLWRSPLDPTSYDQVKIILDANVWKKPIEKVNQISRVKQQDIDFQTWDSAKAPGIQFADIAAGIRTRSRKGVNFAHAVEVLDSLEIPR